MVNTLLIGNWQLAFGNLLVRLFGVLRSCLNPAGQFRLAFLFLIGLFAGVNRCRDRAGFARRGITSGLRYLPDFLRGL
jgi:hypothetical protein